MDPKTLLNAIVEHTAQLAAFLSNGEEMSVPDAAMELATELYDMHEWLSIKGGFVPDGMTRAFLSYRADAVDKAEKIIRRYGKGHGVSTYAARNFCRAVQKLI